MRVNKRTIFIAAIAAAVLLVISTRALGYSPPNSSPAQPIDAGSVLQYRPTGGIQFCGAVGGCSFGAGTAVSSGTVFVGSGGVSLNSSALSVQQVRSLRGFVMIGGSRGVVVPASSMMSSVYPREGALVYDGANKKLAFYDGGRWRNAETLYFIPAGPARSLTLTTAGQGKVAVFNHRWNTGSRAVGYCRGTCSMRYEVGDKITLYAVRDAGGSAFMWGDGVCVANNASSDKARCEFTLNDPQMVAVTFQ